MFRITSFSVQKRKHATLVFKNFGPYPWIYKARISFKDEKKESTRTDSWGPYRGLLKSGKEKKIEVTSELESPTHALGTVGFGPFMLVITDWKAIET